VVTRVRGMNNEVENGKLLFIIINNCLSNSVVSHVQNQLMSMVEMNKSIKSNDVVLKMFSKGKLKTLKMKA
jgi:hypothetical protein